MERHDLQLVMHVRERGSLAGAAHALGVAPSVITKRLAALETRLGTRLFDRTTRRLVLTREGEVVCAHAQALLDGFAALESELRERRHAVSGPIRLAATFGFGRLWLAPALADFQAAHPEVRIELRLTEQLPDLVAEGLDGAVWLWSVQRRHASDWVTRRLARNQRVVVAAPGYLQAHGTPAEPDDLARHACLSVKEHDDVGRSTGTSSTWTLRHDRDGSMHRISVEGPLASNSGELVRDWCAAGRGLMLRSLWDVAPLLAEGRLVRVLSHYTMADADIHWIAPWQPRTPRRIRLLVDALVERFKAEPWKSA